jgi:tetratricopeptide (TPR) repeat protein
LVPDLTTDAAGAAGAEAVLRLAESSPGEARRLAEATLADRSTRPEARCLALHALAVSCMQLGRLAEARRCVSAGVALAEEAQLHGRLAELQATSALLWFHAEAPDRALAELDRAAAGAPLGSVATLRGQRAHLLFRLGRFEAGLAETERALAAVPDQPPAVPADAAMGRDPGTVTARILTNRALALAYRGRGADAVADLERALGLYRAAGADALAAQALHNLAFVAGRAGDFPRARRLYDEALADYERLGLPLHQLMVDRAALFAEARLIPEAQAALAAAAEALSDAGYGADAAEALLALAEACIAGGDHGGAIVAAGEASRAFTRQSRPSWGALAAELEARVRREELEAAGDWRGVAASARSSASSLQKAGWPAEAVEAALAGARAALFGSGRLAEGAPDVDLGRAILADLGAADLRGAERLAAAHVEVLDRLATGDTGAALAAARDALCGSVDIGRPAAPPAPVSERAAIAALRRPVAASLSESALAIALRDGSPDLVFEWAERRRHLGLRRPLARRVRLDGLQRTLGDRILIELVAVFGSLHAVVVSADGADLVDCGPLDRLAEHCAELLFSLRRLVSPGARRTDAATSQAMWTVLRRSLDAVDRALGSAVGSAGGAQRASGREVVVVPAGPLHALPWGLLPSLGDRTVTVAPSAAACPLEHPLPRPQPGGTARRVTLVAGPGVASADEEVEKLAELWQRGSNAEVTVLTGSAASSAGVVAAAARSDVAHLAVHGRLRADSPSMSSLELADGPITLHELARGGSLPRCLVLSACDAARAENGSRELADGESLGSVLEPPPGGTSFAIASVAPVVDRVMPTVAAALHERLVEGQAPPAALAAARRALRWAGSKDERLAGSSFVCHGATSPPPLPGITGSRLGESSR